MVTVKEFTWEEVSAPTFENPAHQAWRAAVSEVAAKAHDKLPECNGRVDAAVKMVLAGDVELLADGTARVASQSNGQTVYHVVNGQCDCKDFAKAPHNFCKHRLAAAIARRAPELVKVKLDAPPAGEAQVWRSNTPPAPLPEAPASCNVYITLAGRQVQVTLRDTEEARLLGRLETLLARYPLEAPACQTKSAAQLNAEAMHRPTSQEQPTPEGWCLVHQCQMKRQTNERGSWWSHKTGDGWCRGKSKGA